MATQAYQGGPYPLWLKARLESLFRNPPRFENSYYGPINGILNCMFPAENNFLVKPQAILIPNHPIVSSIYLPPGTSKHPDVSRTSSRISKVAAAKAPASKAPQGAEKPGIATGSMSHNRTRSTSGSSVDSFGDNILPRSQGGWIEGIFIPDFLVVKATEHKDQDIALVLVEVKLNDLEEATSIGQVEVYLNCLQTKNYSNKLVAFLCMGPKTLAWKTTGQGNNLMQERMPQYVITGSIDFCTYMHPVWRQHR